MLSLGPRGVHCLLVCFVDRHSWPLEKCGEVQCRAVQVGVFVEFGKVRFGRSIERDGVLAS